MIKLTIAPPERTLHGGQQIPPTILHEANTTSDQMEKGNSSGLRALGAPVFNMYENLVAHRLEALLHLQNVLVLGDVVLGVAELRLELELVVLDLLRQLLDLLRVTSAHFPWFTGTEKRIRYILPTGV